MNLFWPSSPMYVMLPADDVCRDHYLHDDDLRKKCAALKLPEAIRRHMSLPLQQRPA